MSVLPTVEPVYCDLHQPHWGSDPTNWCVEFHGDYYPFGFRETALRALTWWYRAIESGKMYKACERCAAGAARRKPPSTWRKPPPPVWSDVAYWNAAEELREIRKRMQG